MRIALREAKNHLPRNPQTNHPYRCWGFFAPYAAFKRLGADVYVYMRFLHELMAVAIISTFLQLAPMAHNMKHDRAKLQSIWASTSIGMSDRVRVAPSARYTASR